MGRFRWTTRSLLPLTVVWLGCAPAETGPSYADLVVIYNAELEALDRLEAKREKLLVARAAAVQKTKSPLSNLQGLLDEVKQLKDKAVGTEPNTVIDDLAHRSGRAEELAGQLLEGLLQGSQSAADGKQNTQGAEPETPPDEAAESIATELAALNKEIETQKARVERARNDRDAAEARQGK